MIPNLIPEGTPRVHILDVSHIWGGVYMTMFQLKSFNVFWLFILHKDDVLGPPKKR